MLQTSEAPKDRISEHILQKQKLSDVSLSAAAVGRFMKTDNLENISTRSLEKGKIDI